MGLFILRASLEIRREGRSPSNSRDKRRYASGMTLTVHRSGFVNCFYTSIPHIAELVLCCTSIKASVVRHETAGVHAGCGETRSSSAACT